MSTALLYHGFGLRGIRYKTVFYKKNKLIFHAVITDQYIKCPRCHRRDFIFKGRKIRKFHIRNVRYIGIDEFSIKKGHKYMTIFVDLSTGRILHVVEGKSKEAILPFLRKENWIIFRSVPSRDLASFF